jgi:hypothetical protein
LQTESSYQSSTLRQIDNLYITGYLYLMKAISGIVPSLIIVSYSFKSKKLFIQDKWFELETVSGNEDTLQIVIQATPAMAQLTRNSFIFECQTKIEYFVWMTELGKALSLNTPIQRKGDKVFTLKKH